jgi:hypothetical protein
MSIACPFGRRSCMLLAARYPTRPAENEACDKLPAIVGGNAIIAWRSRHGRNVIVRLPQSLQTQTWRDSRTHARDAATAQHDAANA